MLSCSVLWKISTLQGRRRSATRISGSSCICFTFSTHNASSLVPVVPPLSPSVLLFPLVSSSCRPPSPPLSFTLRPRLSFIPSTPSLTSDSGPFHFARTIFFSLSLSLTLAVSIRCPHAVPSLLVSHFIYSFVLPPYASLILHIFLSSSLPTCASSVFRTFRQAPSLQSSNSLLRASILYSFS